MILAHLDTLERALVAAEFPPMSPWWRDTLAGFYASRRRQLVLRVGRRGGKSSTLCRIAVLEALFGEHIIPPGDVGIVGIVSVSRDEAFQRLRTIRAVLDALAIRYRPIENGIELEHRPIAFKVFAASIAGVVGGTWIVAICDEVSRWRDSDTGANPATEVLASLRPTMATQPHARIFLSSSPLGMSDAHATAFDAGDTDFQGTAFAPTWVANPTVTEEQTHELEPDDRVWRREYAAEAQAGSLSCFDPAAIDRAFSNPPKERYVAGRCALILDPSSGRKDSWSWGVCHWIRPCLSEPGKPLEYLRFEVIDAVEGRFFEQISGMQIVTRLAAVCTEWGVHHVFADQRESLMLAAAFKQYDLRYHIHDWTAQTKPAAVERVRRWLADGVLILPEHAKLRRELLSFEERITPSGSFTFGARGSGHDDFVALLLTAAMADLSRELAPAIRERQRIPAPIIHPGQELRPIGVWDRIQFSRIEDDSNPLPNSNFAQQLVQSLTQH